MTGMEHFTRAARRVIEASSEKVILLGHRFGGASYSYLTEQLPETIAAAVYLAAFLGCDGGTTAVSTQQDSALEGLIAPIPAGIKLDLSNLARVKVALYADYSDHDVSVAVRNIVPVDPRRR